VKLIDRIDGVCNYYYFKPWKQLTEAQKRRSIELYKHWTHFANTSYWEEWNNVKESQAEKA